MTSSGTVNRPGLMSWEVGGSSSSSSRKQVLRYERDDTLENGMD